MDPLSDVLSLLKLRSYMSRGLDAGGAWSIGFGPHDDIKFYAIVSGACWLSVEGVAEPLRVGAGDCFLLPRGRPFRLASDLSLPAVDALAIFPPAQEGGIVSYNGGGDVFGIGGYFTLTGNLAGILLGLLPPIVHIRKESDRAVLRWCVERMMLELREPQPGGFLIAQQLAGMMLIQALRLHLADSPIGSTGWLFALADKQMRTAITAMHADPAQPWTLQSLAERAGLSRTTFTIKFKQTVGVSPMEYLARWRMLLAGDRLANSGDSIGAISLSVGYKSESAFSTAFRRVMGCSPRQYTKTDPAAG